MVRLLAGAVSRDTYLNLMDQFDHANRAGDDPELERPITAAEFDEALAQTHRYGLTRVDHDGQQ